MIARIPAGMSEVAGPEGAFQYLPRRVASVDCFFNRAGTAAIVCDDERGWMGPDVLCDYRHWPRSMLGIVNPRRLFLASVGLLEASVVERLVGACRA